MSNKSLHNTTANGATKNVKDIKFWGDGDMFKLLCKASSEKEGWMKSTKAMEIPQVGCVVQVTTQQLNDTGVHRTYSDNKSEVQQSVIAEALTFVPGVKIAEIFESGEGTLDTDLDAIPVTSRKLVPLDWDEKEILRNQ